MEQTFEQVLAHYGVKGMAWGKRKKSTGPTEVSVVSNPAGKGKIKTAGGTNQGTSKEALDKAIVTQKAKGSGIKSLSNNELQNAVRRMQLEQQFSELNAKSNAGPLAKGQKVVKELLGLGNTANQVVAFNSSPAGVQLRDQLNKAKK